MKSKRKFERKTTTKKTIIYEKYQKKVITTEITKEKNKQTSKFTAANSKNENFSKSNESIEDISNLYKTNEDIIESNISNNQNQNDNEMNSFNNNSIVNSIEMNLSTPKNEFTKMEKIIISKRRTNIKSNLQRREVYISKRINLNKSLKFNERKGKSKERPVHFKKIIENEGFKSFLNKTNEDKIENTIITEYESEEDNQVFNFSRKSLDMEYNLTISRNDDNYILSKLKKESANMKNFQKKESRVFNKDKIDDENHSKAKLNESQESVMKRIKLLDTISFIFVLINLIIGAVDLSYLNNFSYEIEFKPYKLSSINLTIRIINLIITCLNVLVIIYRYKLKLQRMKIYNKVIQNTKIWSLKILKPMVFELILVGIVPLPFYENYFTTTMGDGIFIFTFTSIIYYISFLKILYFIRIFSHYSIFTQPEVKVKSKLLKRSIGVKFAFKSQLNNSPVLFLVGIFAITLIFMTIFLYTSERFYYNNNDYQEVKSKATETLLVNTSIPQETISEFEDKLKIDKHITNFEESLWLTIVTMLTIGYGDKLPFSLLGKLSLFLSALLGMIITTLIIAFIYNLIDFSYKENNAFIKKKTIENEEIVRNYSILLITYVMKLNKQKVILKKEVNSDSKRQLKNKYIYISKIFDLIEDIKAVSSDFSVYFKKNNLNLFPVQEILNNVFDSNYKQIQKYEDLTSKLSYISEKIRKIQKNDKILYKKSRLIDEKLDLFCKKLIEINHMKEEVNRGSKNK